MFLCICSVTSLQYSTDLFKCFFFFFRISLPSPERHNTLKANLEARKFDFGFFMLSSFEVNWSSVSAAYNSSMELLSAGGYITVLLFG